MQKFLCYGEQSWDDTLAALLLCSMSLPALYTFCIPFFLFCRFFPSSALQAHQHQCDCTQPCCQGPSYSTHQNHTWCSRVHTESTVVESLVLPFYSCGITYTNKSDTLQKVRVAIRRE